jgi:uncharacterized membrane protein
VRTLANLRQSVRGGARFAVPVSNMTGEGVISDPSILAIHIGAGVLALAPGTAALIYRKGHGPHRIAGTMFFLSMLVLSASAIYLAYVKLQVNIVIGGALSIYMIATGLVAARRQDGESGAFEIVACAVASMCAIGMFILGFKASSSPNGQLYGQPYSGFYGIGAFLSILAALDVSVIVRSGLAGAQRIARHLWRMCFSLMGAFFAFAVQGARALPLEVRHSGILFVPPVVVIVVMLFWLARVLLTNRYRNLLQSMH